MATSDDLSSPPSVVVQRQVEWSDTDAAGHYHNSTVIRWVEAAEAVLLDRLRLLDQYPAMPRVHYEASYLRRLWFQDTVDIALRVESVGRASVKYGFDVRRGEDLAAHGTIVAVKTDPDVGGSVPWDNLQRAALTSGG